jgi:RNA polymerase sigma-70 factor (ECF subfamily)
MFTRDMTFIDTDRAARLQADANLEATTFVMDEETFRAFYDRTSRAVWAYLSRLTGDRQLADDLLQESYYRFLRAGASHENEAHRRNSLFRIATNLARDAHRRRMTWPTMTADDPDHSATRRDTAEGVERKTDLTRALGHMKPRERALLWLAYAEGSSHREIAETLGVKLGSVKLLLFRARRRLAKRLSGGQS